MESGTKEETGQKHTKHCIKCDTPLMQEVNWWDAFIRKNYYCCKECYKQDREQRRLAQKAKALGIRTLESYNRTKKGYIYMISNPAWQGWIKVGMAVDANDRLSNYQTASPERDYELIHKTLCKDRRKAESFIHNKLSEVAERNGEWFKVTTKKALAVFDLLRERNYSV